MTHRDLYYCPPGVRFRRVIEAIYPYLDVNGAIVAEKVRYRPKSFRWRVTDASGRQRWELDGIELPLYNLPELIEARRVIKVEGERSVDLLRQHGFIATCGSSGASTWREDWTQSLWECGCEELIIIEDNDMAGKSHARTVAEAAYGFTGRTQNADQGKSAPWHFSTPTEPATAIAAMRVKLISLDVPTAGDVVDWFDAGHSASELIEIIASAPYWTPRSEQQARDERRRQKCRDRVRAHRARKRNAANVRASEIAAGNALNISAGFESDCSAQYVTVQGQPLVTLVTL